MSKAAAVQATMRAPSWPEVLHLIKEICGYILNHNLEIIEIISGFNPRPPFKTVSWKGTDAGVSHE